MAQNETGHAIWIAGDAERGRTTFGQCSACHAVGPRAKHKTGPHFVGLVGRSAGTAKDYPYSIVLVKLGLDELRWTALTLDHFLMNPDAMIEHGPMMHVGIPDPQQRADLIEFLKDPDSAWRRARAKPLR